VLAARKLGMETAGDRANGPSKTQRLDCGSLWLRIRSGRQFRGADARISRSPPTCHNGSEDNANPLLAPTFKTAIDAKKVRRGESCIERKSMKETNHETWIKRRTHNEG
jgi:hypothetical protein